MQPCHVVYTDFRPTPLQHYIFPAGGDGLHLVVDENVRKRTKLEVSSVLTRTIIHDILHLLHTHTHREIMHSLSVEIYLIRFLVQ